MRNLEGHILTVNGPIEAEKAGITLPHEHLFSDLSLVWFQEPESTADRKLAHSKIQMENLWWYRRHIFNSVENMRMKSYEDALAEVMMFKREGGSTIVDVTPKGLGGDPKIVKKISNQTRLNIVLGTAYYAAKSHPPSMSSRSVDDIAEEFEQDILKGIDGTNIRAGIIGEIGLDSKNKKGETFLHENEVKVLRAAARAQVRTGVAVSIHPPVKKDPTYPRSKWSLDILEILREEGAVLSRVAIGHMDTSIYEKLEYLLEIAKRGAYVELDCWGWEGYRDDLRDYYPSDMQRTEIVKALVGAGYLERILLSHDVGMKLRLTKYGGNGYGHLLRSVVPMLSTAAKLTKDQISTMLVENPKRLLQIK